MRAGPKLKTHNFTGRLVGLLTIGEPTRLPPTRFTRWHSTCRCGGTAEPTTENIMRALRLGTSLSCGCARRGPRKQKSSSYRADIDHTSILAISRTT